VKNPKEISTNLAWADSTVETKHNIFHKYRHLHHQLHDARWPYGNMAMAIFWAMCL
jgi:hypothetical protein